MWRLILLLLCACLAATGQQPLLRHFTVKDGLPSNVIYNLHQDRRGFLWLCTDEGLSCFDGHRFVNYGLNEGLPDNEVLGIGEDPAGRYWLVCYNHEPCYLKAGRVYTPRNDALCRQVQALGLDYSAVFTNSRGQTCLGGRRIGVVSGDSVVLRYTAVPENGDQGIYKALNGREYIVRRDAVSICRGRTAKTFRLGVAVYATLFRGNRLFITSNLPDASMLHEYRLDGDTVYPEATVSFPAYAYDLSPAPDGAIWCLTANGLYTYEPASHSLHGPEPFSKATPFNRLLQDKDGNTWLGTLSDGVYLRGKDSIRIYNRASGLRDERMQSLNLQPDGRLLANSSDGFSRIGPAGIANIALPVLGKLNRILFSYALPDGDFLAGSDRGLYRIQHDGGKRLLLQTAQKAAFRAGDRFYVGFSGGASIYNAATGTLTPLWRERTTAIAADPAGTAWLGTLHGLYYTQGDTVRKFDRDPVLGASRITALALTSDGRLAIASHAHGLYLWDGRQLLHLDQAAGLGSDRCLKLTPDTGRLLWVCTDRGLDCIRLEPGARPRIRHYGAADGLPAGPIQDVAVSGNRLYLATTEGVLVLQKDAARHPLRPPRAYILSVAARDTVLNEPSDFPVRFSYRQNDLRLTYTGISFSNGNELEYRYLLEGGSTDTVRTGLSTVNLSALQPGDYQLLLWARRAGEPDWSDQPARFAFSVRAPFWLTPWFWLALAVAAAAGINAVYRRRVRAVHRAATEKAAQQQQLAELEMQALRAQINPHFLFNALNSIQHFYSQNDERQANHYMSLFAQLIRKTLHHAKTHWLPLSEELAMLNAYVALEQMRFKHAFDYDVVLGAGIQPQQVRIPAMLIQPYVENAIRHGLRPLRDRHGRLRLTFERAGDALHCRIEDNGIGMQQADAAKPAGHQSMGLAINQQRVDAMNRMYHTDIAISLESTTGVGPDAGTRVTLLIPLIDSWTS